MKTALLHASFFVSCLSCFSQDSTFVKSFTAGSSVKVPMGKTWSIEKAFISNGDGYQIKIAKTNFKEQYKSAEQIVIPYYIAEMELLTDRSMLFYLVTIKESKELN
jgi:hypothetical protein